MDELALRYSVAFNVSLEKAEAEVQKLREAILKAYESIKKFIVKTWEALKQFFKDNPLLINHLLKSYKYQKRVYNRNKLYNRRKKLGRKL